MNPSAPEHFDAIAERYAASEVHAQSRKNPNREFARGSRRRPPRN